MRVRDPTVDRRAAVDRPPLDGRLNDVAPGLESTPVMDEVVEDLPDDLFEVPGPMVPELRKVLVDRVVVVLLGLDPRVGRVLDDRRKVELLRDPSRGLRELVDGVGRVELVEHAVLPRLR